MQQITFERSRGKTAATALGAIALTAFCYLLVYNADDFFERLIGWSGVVFFGAVAVSATPQILRAGAVFSLDERGFNDARGLSVRWEEVERVAVVHVRGVPFLGVWFREPPAVLARASNLRRHLSALNERTGAGHWSFSFSTVSPGIDAAVEFIRDHVPSVRMSRR